MVFFNAWQWIPLSLSFTLYQLVSYIYLVSDHSATVVWKSSVDYCTVGTLLDCAAVALAT